MTRSILAEISQEHLEAGATDLLFRVGEVPRVRREGALQLTQDPPVSVELVMEFADLCGVDLSGRCEVDARLKLESGSLRANFYQASGRLALAVRPIKEEIPSLEDLGLPVQLLRDWVDRKSGILLVTGPTGAGKSTTLAACLQDLNQRAARHIITVEDPVEYLFSHEQCFFSQREVEADTASFSDALRSSLRQSPDLIMIGEIRDEETARFALRAAETGHLVLATLHSSGVVETVERVCNLFSGNDQESATSLLAQQLIGILSQKLLPRVDDGLQLVYEHLLNQGATRKWIKTRAMTDLADFLRRNEPPEWNRDFLTSLLEVVNAGQVRREDAVLAAANPGNFNRLLSGIS